MGLFYGFSGYGKSVASAFAAARTDAAYVEAKSIWTQRTLLEEIAGSLGLPPVNRSGPRILGQIIEHLGREPRPLVIDEMDYLVKRQSVEIIRDIHDATSIPILMIGGA
jgi:Cdc6-like AAA superfamily ATPase